MNEDGSQAPQIQGIRPQASGVCLMNDIQAAPILRENQKLSSDELAILVVGHQYPEHVPSQEVTFPCTNSNGQEFCFMDDCTNWVVNKSRLTRETHSKSQRPFASSQPSQCTKRIGLKQFTAQTRSSEGAAH